MNILLIQPQTNWSQTWVEAPAPALLILGTLAKERGHKVKILHLNIDSLGDDKPDIVGISVNTFGVKSARELVKHFQGKDARVIIGGPHASVWDGGGEVVIGEGENKWLEILGEKPVINNLDDIPSIDYSLVDLRRFTGISPLIGAVPSMCMMASRGCIGECTFCNTPVFWGRKVRYHSPEYIVAEVERLHKLGAREIFFQDDTFNINHKWASEIFEGIIRKELNREMVFRITSRVNHELVTKEFLELAKRAGVWNIFYGIESGSQYMLDRMKKKVTVEEIKRAVKMTNELGIKTVCSFIVGLPGEGFDTLEETRQVIAEIKPSHHGWGYACPFPKTEFREEVTKNGHIQDTPYDEYTYGMLIVRTEKLDYPDLENFRGFN